MKIKKSPYSGEHTGILWRVYGARNSTEAREYLEEKNDCDFSNPKLCRTPSRTPWGYFIAETQIPYYKD